MTNPDVSLMLVTMIATVTLGDALQLRARAVLAKCRSSKRMEKGR